MTTNFVILILLSIAPAVILLWYFDRHDKVHKESRKFLWRIFMWGVTITMIAAGIEVLLENIFGGIFSNFYVYIFVSSFIFTAITEEGLKFFVVKKKAYENPQFNEHIDGIIYAVTASLGFATLENLLYVLEGGIDIAILRAFLAVPAHALFGCMMGYYFGLAKFSKSEKEELALQKRGLYLAVFFHGLYNFLLLTQSAFALLVIPVLMGMFINITRKIRHLQVLDKIDGITVPAHCTTRDYFRFAFALILTTFGLLLLFIAIIVFIQSPFALEVFADTEVDAITSLIISALLLGGTYLLLKEKPRKKSFCKIGYLKK